MQGRNAAGGADGALVAGAFGGDQQVNAICVDAGSYGPREQLRDVAIWARRGIANDERAEAFSVPIDGSLLAPVRVVANSGP